MRRTTGAALALLTVLGTTTGAAASAQARPAHVQTAHVQTTAARTTPRACTTADLSVRVEPGSPGAGQRFATLVLTDTSARACTVRGYGGLALLGAPGQGVPTDLQRDVFPAPTTVVLAPGGSARSSLAWTAVAGPGEDPSACEPVAPAVAVTPPGQRTAALLPWAGGPVCQHGMVHQQAYAPGSSTY